MNFLKCDIHKGEICNLVCSEEKKLICFKCFTGQHSNHKEKIGTFCDFYDEELKKFTKKKTLLCSQAKEKFLKYLGLLNENKKKVEILFEEYESENSKIAKNNEDKVFKFKTNGICELENITNDLDKIFDKSQLELQNLTYDLDENFIINKLKKKNNQSKMRVFN